MAKTELERLFAEKPSFMLTGEINESTADAVDWWLGWWNDRNPKKRLSVFIDSVGGELFAATRIAESFKISPNSIRTIATGKCYSGGALVVAAGDKGERHAYKSADFMVHQLQILSNGDQQSVPEREEETAYLKRLNDTFLGLLAEFTGRPLEQIRKETKKEKYMSTEEAIKWGLIDKIAEWKKPSKRTKVSP